MVRSDDLQMIVRAAFLALMLLPIAGFAAAQSDRTGVAKAKKDSTPPPIVFYLAKGEADACGPGCNEWIAAEGQIDAGAAQRLSSILTRVGRRKLPIFFHSPGGIGSAALTMGRMLRAREMTAGVSQTIPAACQGVSEQVCRSLKQSGQVLQSSLRSFSTCSSACVFALIGAKVRQVPPGSRLGVHAGKVLPYRMDGSRIDLSDKQVALNQRIRLEEINAQMRRYVQEMKIDARMFDLLSKVPHESIHYLTRDEIVSFGIDIREFNETRWVATELLPQKLWVVKFFVTAKDERRKELRQSFIRMECGSPLKVKLAYFRGLGLDDNGIKRTIDLNLAERKVRLFGTGSLVKLDAIEAGTSFELWGTELSLDDIEAAGARDSIQFTEFYNADVPTRVAKLSTAGLSQAVGTLRTRCDAASN